MVYQYTYITESVFQPAVAWHFFKLRAVPCANEFQQVHSTGLEVTPSCALSHSFDGQGNALQWGSFDYPHTEFRVVSVGTVQQVCPYVLHEAPRPYYLTPTHLTTVAGARQLLLDQGIPLHGQPFALAAEVMHLVHRHITYSPCHTTTATTAAEVWLDARGVCQDYSHLMIAFCRALGLHARYVNGFIPGEGQTHAWVEVSDGREWRPFDPTHDVTPQWGYVKVAHGRDADDCPTNRGRFYAWTSEQMSVRVQLSVNSDQ